MCSDGALNTDGSNIIDIRGGFEDENAQCAEYIEVCCETGDVVPEPITPPGIKVAQKCGLRNTNGVGFRITGNNDNEAEYGKEQLLFLEMFLKY